MGFKAEWKDPCAVQGAKSVWIEHQVRNDGAGRNGQTKPLALQGAKEPPGRAGGYAEAGGPIETCVKSPNRNSSIIRLMSATVTALIASTSSSHTPNHSINPPPPLPPLQIDDCFLIRVNQCKSVSD